MGDSITHFIEENAESQRSADAYPKQHGGWQQDGVKQFAKSQWGNSQCSFWMDDLEQVIFKGKFLF